MRDGLFLSIEKSRLNFYEDLKKQNQTIYDERFLNTSVVTSQQDKKNSCRSKLKKPTIKELSTAFCQVFKRVFIYTKRRSRIKRPKILNAVYNEPVSYLQQQLEQFQEILFSFMLVLFGVEESQFTNHLVGLESQVNKRSSIRADVMNKNASTKSFRTRNGFLKQLVIQKIFAGQSSSRIKALFDLNFQDNKLIQLYYYFKGALHPYKYLHILFSQNSLE